MRNDDPAKPAPRAAGRLPSMPRAGSQAEKPKPNPNDSGPVVVASTSPTPKDRNDATMIVTPPPAPSPAPTPPRTMTTKVGAVPPPQMTTPPPVAAPPPAVADPVKVRFNKAPTRPKSDSIGTVLDDIANAPAQQQPVHGVSTQKDLEEVRSVFNDIAAVHVSAVRDVMLELHYGDASASWIEATKPALRSLRAMAEQLELGDLCNALDAFCAAVDQSVGRGATIGDAEKAVLVGKYQRLIELIPQAFELDAERDRREPIIVEALLYQVEGVEKRTVEKLFAVGLARLEALLKATSEEMAVVAGIRPELADSIALKLRAYREHAASAVSAPDPTAERKQLADLLLMLSVQNDEYAHAASQWTAEAKAKKRDAMKQREQIFQRIKLSLARLGEREQLVKLEKLPFEERIAHIDRYLTAQLSNRPQPGRT